MPRPVNQLPDRDLLLEFFEYRPDTGLLIRRRKVKGCGKPAGSLKDGEITVGIDHREYRAHRLIWKMVYGDPVPDVIDHVDGDPHNNRIENLRAADSSQNHANNSFSWSNTGVRGVSRKKDGKFQAYLSFRRKAIWLGLFDTLDEAVEARKAAAKEIYGEFAREHALAGHAEIDGD